MGNRISPPSLIVPIETKVRELHGKCLLAACAAEAGMPVVLGDQRVIAQSLHQLPRGIYVDKTIARVNIGHYRRLKRLGFCVVSWCEEGLLYRVKEKYQFERVSAEALEPLDAFIAWGEVHRRDIVEVVPEAAGKIHVHGNPRFDLLRPALREVFEDDARALMARLGPYIMVNTNFSAFNRFKGRESVIEVLRARGVLTKKEQEDFYVRFVDHLGQVFDAFAAMIPRLARAMPDHTIIVRPHPSEDHDRWREVLAGVGNVKVQADSNIVPWLLGARAVIHNACTTGVEAFLLDRPTIAYVPIVHEVFNRLSYLPNAISTIGLTADEVITAARAASEDEPPDARDLAEKKDLITRHVANASGALAAERIVRTLLDMHEAEGLPDPGRLRLAGARLRSAVRKTAVRTRRALRRDTVLTTYMDQKFPSLSVEEVQAVMDRLAAVRKQTTSFRVSKHPSLPSCFLVTADRAADAPVRQPTADPVRSLGHVG